MEANGYSVASLADSQENEEEPLMITITINDRAAAEERCKQILSALTTIQSQIAVLSDELDSDDMENAEGDIEEIMQDVMNCMEANGWEIP